QDLAREELFAGWRLWFERLAANQPVVLLIEDLHKADEGLLDFLDHLLDWARDVAIFVLTFSRPEMRVDRPEWGTGRNRTVLALDPLDAESVGDRKSTRLNSSHDQISYAVFCLKKKK